MFTRSTLKSGVVALGCAVLISVLGGCTRTNAPTVSSTVPADAAVGVAVNASLSATFSMAMTPASINATTFTLQQGTTPVLGTVSYSGVTATFNPTSNLLPNTLYTATITTGASAPLANKTCAGCDDDPDFLNKPDDVDGAGLGFIGVLLLLLFGISPGGGQSGGPLADDFVWTFTTGASTGEDTIAPTVASNVPLCGATGVAIGGNLSITFSEAMNPASISSTTFTLNLGNTPVLGTVSYSGNTATFNPSVVLAPNTIYSATITTGVEDLAGNNLVSNHTCTFTTGITQDTTAPTVISTVPADGATDVGISMNLTATFSEAMNPLTINTATFTLDLGVLPITGTVTYQGATAIFNPAFPLAPNTTYTAMITTGAEDLAGNALATNHVWTFTTATSLDNTPPSVSSTVPADEGVGVPLGTNLTVTFTEVMDPSTINATTFTLNQGTIPVLGTVTYTGITAVFNPTVNLIPNTTYTATIWMEVTDLAGNQMLSDYVWSFTTGAVADNTAPIVTSTVPVRGSLGVPLGTNLSVTFSEAMDPLTINTTSIILENASSVAVTGTVTYSGVTATFNPTNNLAPNTTYTAFVTTEAADLSGNNLAAEYSWTFTTGTNPDNTVPMVSSTVPENGGIDVSFGANISATFTEAMNPLTINSATFTVEDELNNLIPGTVSYVGVTATFNPSSNLTPNTVYFAFISQEAADLSGNTLTEDYVWTFITGADPDSTAPMVSSTVPENGSLGVSLSGNLSATFTEAMDPLTINTSTFILEDELNVQIPGTVTYVGVTATFNPSANLAPNTVYFAIISAEAADLSGNTLAEDYVWTFTTGDVPDNTAPMVSSTSPADGVVGTPLNKKIAATFSEAMDPLTISTATFTLRQGTTPVLGTVTYAGVTATFTPVGNLLPSMTYTATVWMEASDLAGNTMADDYVWTFTTSAGPDITAPTVSSTIPANGAIGVPLNNNLAATFSEAMDPLTINATTFTLRNGITVIPGTVSYAGVTATFNPISALTSNTTYTATIMMESEDLAGNPMASDYVWSFTTSTTLDTTAPMVSSTTPDNGDINTSLGANLSATFSEAMNPLTINTSTFTLSQGLTRVSGTVTYSGVTAIFNPANALAPNTVYTAMIWMEATDLAGNPMLSDYMWTITTGDTPDTSAPMVTSTSPVDGAQGVSINKKIAATFSEAMDPLTINSLTFTLRQGTTPVVGAVTYAGVTATLTPVGALLADTTYTATVWMEATDLAGNPMTSDYVWTFTTGSSADTTAPMVSSTVPPNGSTSVPLPGNISATFSEAMNPLTITSATFTVDNGTTLVSGTVTYSGVTAVFNPTSSLAPNTAYIATITTEAEDLAGNPMLLDHVWTFTTGASADTTAPMVSSTVPANGAIGVSLGGNISATFSEAMNPLTITSATFTVDNGTTLVSGTVTYSGVTAVFNPTSALAPNTVYFATITTEAEDLTGNPMLTDHVWTFTTGASADTTAPMVSSTSPENGVVGTPLNKKISATFSEAMDPLTINTATFTLDDGVTSVLGTVSYAGVTATFTPATDLAPSTTYTATVWMEASDLAGNMMASDFVWTFTTGDVPDTEAPMVSSTVPFNGRIGYPISGNISATFSEEMNPLTMNTSTFTLDNGTTLVSGTVTYTGVTAVFNPTSALAPNTAYIATILAGVEDLAGNTMAANYVWTFTTGDTPDNTAPMVSSTSPVDGANGVPLNKKISATFSEAMDPLTINTATFTLDDGVTPVLGTVTYAGVTATFTPATDLAPNTTYTAAIWMEASDLAGNMMANDYVWTFTTGDAPDIGAPEVISTDPLDAAIGVPINTQISATFSEEMNPLTINTTTFTLREGTTAVIGTVSYVGVTATFTPVEDLVANLIYTATVTMEAEDLAGNPMVSDYVWIFTTGDAPDIGEPTVVSTSPIDGAVGVPINKKVTATFSEAMDPLTINTLTFTVFQGLTEVLGTVTYLGDTATFTPATNLVANLTYTATVTMEATDLAGNPMASDYVWTFDTGITTAQDTINLRSAGNFAILAGSTVTNTGPSIVNGDLGVSPGTAVVGFPPGLVINGAIFTGIGSAAGQAKLDLTMAFNEAAARSNGPVSLPGDISGLTLYPGLYTNSTTVMLSAGNVTLDAQGDENAVFLFQMGSTLTTGTGTQVVLAGGAKEANIYWQVGTSATLGTFSIFKGNILAQEAITLETGASLVQGRALTQTAAVSLDAATITVPAP